MFQSVATASAKFFFAAEVIFTHLSNFCYEAAFFKLVDLVAVGQFLFFVTVKIMLTLIFSF